MACAQVEGVPRTPHSKCSTPLTVTFLSGSTGLAGVPFVVGPVTDRAEHVTIYLADGTVVRTATFPAPPALESQIRFYLSMRLSVADRGGHDHTAGRPPAALACSFLTVDPPPLVDLVAAPLRGRAAGKLRTPPVWATGLDSRPTSRVKKRPRHRVVSS
jgi:hypothetical protein